MAAGGFDPSFLSVLSLIGKGGGENVRVIVMVVGPTAVGKTGLALALAERMNGAGRPTEIVNADSMLLYRGMDIGTAKPTLAERGRVRHHLIDILDVTQTATVAEFQSLARTAISDCLDRSVTPLVVGGSALYIRAVADDFRFPGTDPQLRAALEEELDRSGAPALHRRLAALDPAAAATVQPGNGRRIVRALEVIELTGEPYRATLPEHRYALPDVRQFGLDAPRDVLYARIADRVDQMWRAGFVAEVEKLKADGLRSGVTASRALGYRQLLDHLDGVITEEDARQLTVIATRKFARRQASWFRRDPRIRWLSAGSPGGSPGGPGPGDEVSDAAALSERLNQAAAELGVED